MKRHQYLITVLMLAGSMLSTQAQTTHKGHVLVYDEENQPIPGVVISIKGQDKTATTDADGAFTLDFSDSDVLTFRHINYLYKEAHVKVKEGKDYIVCLKDRFKDETASYSNHFGDQQAAYDNLGATTTVVGRDLKKYLSTDIITGLQGRMTGLNISQYRGFDLQRTSVNTTEDLIGNRPANYGQLPFSDNTRFTLSARGLAPVVIVDGVEREFFELDPENIESVTLEKDALSSMFLGMKSSRGALVITTKNPTKGKLHFGFTGKWGSHSNIKTPEPLDATEYSWLLNEALTNDGGRPLYTPDAFQAFKDGSQPFLYPNVNWYDELLKKNALSQSYNLNVSGGGKAAQFIVSLGYNNEKGLFREGRQDDYATNFNTERYLMTSKVNVNITRDFTASLNAIARVIEGNQPGGSGSGYSDLLLDLWKTPNNAYPILNPNGTYGGNASFTNNLESKSMDAGYMNDNTRDIFATLRLKYDFNRLVKGLSARLTGSVANQSRTAIVRTKQNPVYYYTVDKDGNENYTLYGNSVSQSNSFRHVATYQKLYGQLAIDYQRQWGLHSFKASLLGDTRHEVVQYDLPMIPSNIMENVKYNYDKRYFAEASVIQSYFNRYAPGNRWGNFWAVGAGWNITAEQFMKEATWLNNLKLRATYGYTGNGIDNSGYYRYRETFQQNATTFYPQGTSMSNGIFTTEVTPIANPYITWEKAHKLNIGIDFSMFGRKLNGSVDFYNNNFSDMLQTRGKSIALLGASYPTENIGKQRRSGLEIAIGWQDHIGTFNYYINGNWTIEKTKMLEMQEQMTPFDYQRLTGRPLGVILGLQANGFLTAEDIANGYPVMTGYEAQPGDVKYVDMNNDNIIDEYDRVVIGGDKPLQYFGLDLGFEYKGIEFSMLWQGAYNRDLYVNDRTLVEGFQTYGQSYGQAYRNLLARWTPETAATARYPRLSAGGNTYNYGGMYGSSLWMNNGNFIRLKNITLAYKLPEVWCNNFLGGLRLKIFVSAQNAFTFSGCDLVDPEVSFTSSPIQKCFFTGINLDF
ncbi:MAG: SusC/RagA family TonB-linked outer membrane protein [Prevotella sp.]|jgi:TonB-linked SusC/RagA family outer membrane protein